MSLARVLLPLCSWLLLAVFQWPGYAARPSDDFSFLVTTSRPWPDPEFNDDEFQSDAPTTGTANTDIFEWTSVGDDTTTETPSEPTVWTEETTGMETQESTTTLLEGTTSPEGATRTTTAAEDGTPPSEEAADTEATEAVPSLTLADSEALPMADRELPPPKVHKLKIKSDIRFRYASTLVHSRVANPANKSQEVVFKVVLPESAFISRFLIEVQGKVFEGYVKEKRAAHKDYQSAVTAGQTAAHIGVSPRNTGVFSVSLNMEPRSKVTFNLTYEELLSRKLGTYNHVVNVNPGQVVPDLDVDVYIRETRHITVLRIPEFRSFAEGNEAKKEYTENSLAKISRYSDRKVRIRFSPTPEQQKELSRDQSGDEGLGGQLVVQYDVDRSQQAGEILVIDGYFVHFFAPTNLKSLRKHVIFVLDTSGSMWGRKIQQLQEAMVTILDNMKRGDYFSLVKFSTTVTEWSPQNKEKNYGVHPVNRKNVDKAKKYILSMEATGATNIHGALRKALDIASRRSNTTDPRDLPEPMVIFLTDGLPTVGEVKPSKIHSSVRTHNTENKIPVFSLAFGEGANFKFLKKLSLQNFGFARKIFEAADAPMQLLGFFNEVASPLLSNVSFSYVEAKIDVQSLTQRTFHTFYEGSEVVVAGKLRDPETQPDQLQGEVTGTTGGQTIQLHSADPFPLQQLPVTTPSPTRLTRQASFIEKLWAYLTVRQLLDKAVEDQPEDLLDLEGLFDYAELEGEEDQLSPKQKAIKTALEYGFVTPFTSLVVVKPDKTNGISETPTEVKEAPTSDFPDSSQMQNKIIPVPMPGRRPTLSNDTPTRLTGPGSSTEASEDGGYEEEDTEIDGNGNLSLKDVTWLPQYLNSSGLLILRNASDEEGEIYKIDEWQIPQFNDGFEACVTAAGASGNCRHISVCVLPQFVDDYTAFLEYFCPIGSYVGVCCPKSAYDARRTEDKEFYTTEEPTTLVSYDEQV